MSDTEFFLILEAKQQSMGKLTHSDYQEIDEFLETRPTTRGSIRGKR